MSSLATRTEVVMPQMGVSVSEGTIASWLVSVGDRVDADEAICEVTTDKIDVEIPCPGAGVLEEIVVEEGETVEVGTVIAIVGGGAAPDAERATEADPPGETGPRETPEAGEIDRSAYHSPVVRRIADEHGIELGEVEGRGVGGRIRKADLLAHIDADQPRGNGHARTLHSESPYRPEPEPGSSPATAEPAGSPDELIGATRREPMAPMRKAIAEHMVASRRTAAHCTTVVEADFGAVARARAGRKEALARRGVPLTYLAYVARAAIEGLERHPILNASIDGNEIVHHEDVNLGIAVALDRGLVVPVIRRAQRLSVEGLAAEIAELAARARGGELTPDDVAGGTFTITNPGQFGAVIATPIINQPQVGILDLEAIVRRPVVVADQRGEESIAVRPMSYLCMSWDHRALDGAEAARFLGFVRARIEAGVEAEVER
ncbi:MAG TPA: 2-oxo acid dehydrogenase subunit E2 [Solirubrobacterales bacterium]|nr:2-oxo acid dehydrogenase subunit E2 [Solirubrobacterales bacterium]